MRNINFFIDRAVELLIVGVFLSMVLVGGAQVFNRFVLNASISWSEEYQRYGQVWIVFLGIPVAYRYGMHIGIKTLQTQLPEFGRRLFIGLVDTLWCSIGIALLIGLRDLLTLIGAQLSPGMGVPMTWAYGGIIIGAGYMIWVGLRRIVSNIMGREIEAHREGE